MNIERKPQTAEANSRLWGACAHDWANIQEGTVLPVYTAVYDRIGLTAGAAHLDAGCGAGMAAQIAADRGACVSGLDAASAGLSPVEVFDVNSPWHYPDVATALRGLKSGGAGVRAMEHAGEAAVDSAYSKAIEPFRQTDGTCQIDATFRCLIARA